MLAGHEHLYERIRAAARHQLFRLRRRRVAAGGDIQRSALTAKGFDTDYSFILMEIAGDELPPAISRTGQTVDAGVISRQTTR